MVARLVHHELRPRCLDSKALRLLGREETVATAEDDEQRLLYVACRRTTSR